MGPLADEFVGAQLGDARRTKRMVRIAEALEHEPRAGFPRALEDEAELEAFYRFINNDGFTAEQVSAPHRRATFERARGHRNVLAIHDSTTVEFSGEATRKGLGKTMAQGRQGFFAHVSLLMTLDATPLGVGHVETWTRTGTKQRKRKVSHRVMRADQQRESMRWLRGVEAIEAQCPQRTEVIHVTDAEGDFFEFLAKLHELDTRFVLRAGQLDRVVETEAGTRSLREVVDALCPLVHRDAALSERRYKPGVPRSQRRKHPERDARTARLAIAATTVQLRKTKYTDVEVDPFDVHVVRVWEPDPPADQPPVEWVLFTSEPIAHPADLGSIVDIYRQRWVIEEYFKALKTGCSLEKRQIESYEALRKVLALFTPIACRLLLLRALERKSPKASARTVFSPLEVQLLVHAPSNRALPKLRTVQDALQHLARLGGHLRHNGPPGWLTLGRGYEKLLLLRLGAQMALKYRMICDQS